MRDVIIEGTLVENHFQIFDTSFYKLLSDNAESLIYRGMIKAPQCEDQWSKTVRQYKTNIQSNIIKTRDQNEVEYNILINGLPLNAELLDFTVNVYNAIKNSYITGAKSVVLHLVSAISHSRTFLENYIKQVLQMINAKTFEVKIIAPKELIAYKNSWAA